MWWGTSLQVGFGTEWAALYSAGVRPPEVDIWRAYAIGNQFLPGHVVVTLNFIRSGCQRRLSRWVGAG
jgi:hypothetical protein